MKGVAPKKGNDWNPLLETDLEAFFLRKVKIQVHAKRPRGQGTHLSDLTPDCVFVRAPEHEHAERAGIAHGGGERGANRAAHRGLDDWHVDPKLRTESGFHAIGSWPKSVETLPYPVSGFIRCIGASVGRNVRNVIY